VERVVPYGKLLDKNLITSEVNCPFFISSNLFQDIEDLDSYLSFILVSHSIEFDVNRVWAKKLTT
jgi:hypothetical protein